MHLIIHKTFCSLKRPRITERLRRVRVPDNNQLEHDTPAIAILAESRAEALQTGVSSALLLISIRILIRFSPSHRTYLGAAYFSKVLQEFTPVAISASSLLTTSLLTTSLRTLTQPWLIISSDDLC